MTGVATRPLLLGGNHHWGRPVLEKGTPVNEGNQPLRDNGEAVANGHCLTLWNSLSPGRQPGDPCRSQIQPHRGERFRYCIAPPALCFQARKDPGLTPGAKAVPPLRGSNRKQLREHSTLRKCPNSRDAPRIRRIRVRPGVWTFLRRPRPIGRESASTNLRFVPRWQTRTEPRSGVTIYSPGRQPGDPCRSQIQPHRGERFRYCIAPPALCFQARKDPGLTPGAKAVPPLRGSNRKQFREHS